jgi:phosphopantetheinyl transferase
VPPPLRIALSYNPRYASDKPAQHSEGRRMLRLVDAEYFPDKPASRIEIRAGGRPFFAERGATRPADFNISHSRNLVALAYCPSAPVGCDAQHADAGRRWEGIAARAFSPADRDYIESAPSAHERAFRFYRIWTFKESYIKLRGWSVFDMRNAPAFAPDSGLPNFGVFQYRVGGGTEEYALSVIRETGGAADAALPELRWFSDPLPVARL